MKNELRPAEGWLFIKPLDEPYGIIQAVSVGMDICCIYDIVQFDEPKPIVLTHLGFLAVRKENITQWGDHGNFQLGSGKE